MPPRPAKPCTHPGCRALVRDGTSRCPDHKVQDNKFADARRGTRHERGYGTEWDKTRLRILRRDAGICQHCLAKGEMHAGNEVDHIVPKGEGGSDDDRNLQVICSAAHKVKTAEEAARARRRTPGAHEVSTDVASVPDGSVFSRFRKTKVWVS